MENVKNHIVYDDNQHRVYSFSFGLLSQHGLLPLRKTVPHMQRVAQGLNPSTGHVISEYKCLNCQCMAMEIEARCWVKIVHKYNSPKKMCDQCFAALLRFGIIDL